MHNFKRLFVLLATASLFVVGFASVASAAQPAITEVDQSGTHIRLIGSHLGRTSNVLFESHSAASINVVSSKEVDATAPSLPVGNYEIYAVTPRGTIDSGIAYVVSPPPPTITGVSSNTASAIGGDTIKVYGTHFSTVTLATIGGLPKTYTLKSDNEIDIVTAAHAAGAVTLSVNTTGGTAQKPFTFVPAGTNYLSVSSTSVSKGSTSGHTTVIIKGNDFTNADKVTFNGVAASSVKVDSPTEITAVTPAAKAGLGVVTVTAGNENASGPWTYQAS
jgi:hypothetical protein